MVRAVHMYQILTYNTSPQQPRGQYNINLKQECASCFYCYVLLIYVLYGVINAQYESASRREHVFLALNAVTCDFTNVINDAIRHTGKDNLHYDEGPCSCPSKDVPGTYCPENGQFTTGGNLKNGRLWRAMFWSVYVRQRSILS